MKLSVLLLTLAPIASAADFAALPVSVVPAATPVRIESPLSAILPASGIAIPGASFDFSRGIEPFAALQQQPGARGTVNVRGVKVAETGGDGRLIPESLWASLKAPQADTLEWLGQRVPRLKRDAVRELGFDAVDSILSQAVARGDSALDVFTDPGFREKGQLFYLSAQTVQKLAASYKIYSLAMFAGKAKDGRAIEMQAIVMGGGKIEMLYDRDFDFDNPDFPEHNYKSASRVTQTIQGPGDLEVAGLSVNMVMHPRIQRFLKLSDDTLRVETNWGNQDRPLRKISAKRSRSSR